jgi:hypothetical protein
VRNTTYVGSFVKIGSGIQKLIRVGRQAHRHKDNLISLLFAVADFG